MLYLMSCTITIIIPSSLECAHLRGSCPPFVVRYETDIRTAAIASGIALSTSPVSTKDMPDAVEMACRYVEAGIHLNPGLGQGNGPIGHFHSLSLQPHPSFQSTLRRCQYQGKARA